MVKKSKNDKKIALDTFISNDTYNQHPNLIIIGGTPRGIVSNEEFKESMLDLFSKESIDTITNDEVVNAKARIKANNIYKFESLVR